MDRARVTLLIAVFAGPAGCVEPADRRADRDFDQVGRVSVGDVRLRVDPGIVVSVDPAARAATIRAGAPAIAVELEGSGSVLLTIENLPDPGVAPFEASAPSRLIVAPPRDDRPVRFAFVSDVHANVDSVERIVAAVDVDAVEFLISGGDLVDTGSDEAEWERTMSAFSSLRVPLYGTNGNHELNGGDGEQHHARFGRMNLAFDHGGVRFVLVDSGSGTLAARVLQFLDASLAVDAPLSVFVTHVPPLDPDGIRNGGFSSTLEGEAVISLLANRGVDLALYGHLHTYVATEQAGIPTYVSGGGADSNTRLDDVGLHVLIVELDPIAGTIQVERRDL